MVSLYEVYSYTYLYDMFPILEPIVNLRYFSSVNSYAKATYLNLQIDIIDIKNVECNITKL